MFGSTTAAKDDPVGETGAAGREKRPARSGVETMGAIGAAGRERKSARRSAEAVGAIGAAGRDYIRLACIPKPCLFRRRFLIRQV